MINKDSFDEQEGFGEIIAPVTMPHTIDRLYELGGTDSLIPSADDWAVLRAYFWLAAETLEALEEEE